MGGKAGASHCAAKAPQSEAGYAVTEAEAAATGRLLPDFFGGAADTVLPVHPEGPVRPLAVWEAPPDPSRECIVGLFLFTVFEAAAEEEDGTEASGWRGLYVGARDAWSVVLVVDEVAVAVPGFHSVVFCGVVAPAH